MRSTWARRSAARCSSLLQVPVSSRPSIYTRRSARVNCGRHFNNATHTFEENDIVFLTELNSHKRPSLQVPIQLSPLKRGDTYRVVGSWAPGRRTRHYEIDHDEIIGARISQTVTGHPPRWSGANKRRYYQIDHPSLADYVSHAQRLVNPIYPTEAEAIVSLLDLHVTNASVVTKQEYLQALDERSSGRPQRLEILEAGAGAGSLTLQLAKAVQPANPDVFCLLPDPEHESTVPAVVAQRPSAEWRRLRGAVVHTVDVDQEHANRARLALRTFRHGLYADNVDFHTSSLIDFLAARRSGIEQGLQKRFAHVLLDIPDLHLHIQAAAEVLMPGGKLVVYAPQVTQMLDCAKMIESCKLDLQPAKILELGPGLSRGRGWMMKSTLKKSFERGKEQTETKDPEALDEGAEAGAEAEHDNQSVEDDGAVWVCRPQYGKHEGAGCFVGVWQKAMPWQGTKAVARREYTSSESSKPSPTTEYSEEINGVSPNTVGAVGSGDGTPKDTNLKSEIQKMEKYFDQ